jgi:hypothetical protein
VAKQVIILPRLMPRERAIERIKSILMSLDIAQGWRLEIFEHKATRSDAQNAYLWGCVYPSILKAGGNMLAGWEPEELHEYCLGEHFGWEVLSGFGKKKQRPIRRSSRLSKLEFMDYIAFIQRRMAEHGIFVPDPDPNWREAKTRVAA